MPIEEIIVPTTEPETEWVAGRALQKMSPTRDHSRVQLAFGIALSAWANGRGEVGTEWRFRLGVSGEALRPLVPDLSFVAHDRLRGRTDEEIQAPTFAPTVAVEILSRGDDPRDVASKVDVYLRAGCELVIVADPETRSMVVRDGHVTITFEQDDVLCHGVLPGFRLALAPFFARALDRRS